MARWASVVCVATLGCTAGLGTPGTDCGNGVHDCDGVCVSSIYLGDGECHVGDGKPNLACASLDFDAGDCGQCGDGTRNEGEQCDDGNDRAGDGCDPSCRLEGADDTGVPGDTGPGECGDGTRQGAEQCDDGNRMNGDGCTRDCTAEILEGQVLLLQAYAGIDSTGKAVGVKLRGNAEPVRLDIVILSQDPQGNPLQCSLGYRPREEDVASVPVGGLPENPTPLQQWLADNGCVWGFQIVPGTGTYEARPHLGCVRDDRYAGDPHGSYLGTEPVYVGLKALPTDAGVTTYGQRYTSPAATENLAGATFLMPTTMGRGAGRLDADGVTLVSYVSSDGNVQVQNGSVVLRPATEVLVDGAPVQGWYTFLQSAFVLLGP